MRERLLIVFCVGLFAFGVWQACEIDNLHATIRINDGLMSEAVVLDKAHKILEDKMFALLVKYNEDNDRYVNTIKIQRDLINDLNKKMLDCVKTELEGK